jgi:signal transduction histidine kinase
VPGPDLPAQSAVFLARLRNALASAGVVPWIILITCLALTVVATTLVHDNQRSRAGVRFRNAVESASDRITGRMELYVNALTGGAAYVTLEPDVTEAEFRTYVQRLDLQRRLPGIQGFGWTERVERTGVDTEIQAIRYLEPLDDRNRAALGFDMDPEVLRRPPLSPAHHTGAPALSGRVTLVQEITEDKQPGFLLYVPVYDGGTIPANVESRRAALRGFVYAPFRSNDLFGGIFGSETRPRVSIQVFDGPTPGAGTLLYESPRGTGTPLLSESRGLTVAGHPWTVVYSSQPGWEAATGDRYAEGTFLFGLLVSLVFFGLVVEQARARAEAEAANQAKMQFLATMSHELRTPLNAIGGFVDLLETGVYGPVTGDQSYALARIRRAGSHLLSLIEDVLSFARIEAGRTAYHIRSVPVVDLALAVDGLVRQQAEAHGIDYRRGPSLEHDVAADPEKAQQILLNLISNALKFTPEGGVVELSWERVGEQVAIRVSDTGIGIPADHLESVFDPFVQVESSLTRTREGTGLGLAISRELARGMGGEVTAASQPGVGSVFTLCLPVSEGARSPHKVRRPAAADGGEPDERGDRAEPDLVKSEPGQPSR